MNDDMSPATSPAGAGVGPPKVAFVSLGCQKALSDSELILTQLSAGGLRHLQDRRWGGSRHRHGLPREVTDAMHSRAQGCTAGPSSLPASAAEPGQV